MEQRAYWDHVAPTKEFTLPLQSELLAQWVTPDSSILDIKICAASISLPR